MENMLRHYMSVCEFCWTVLEPSETGRALTILDVEGIGLKDFAGQVISIG